MKRRDFILKSAIGASAIGTLPLLSEAAGKAITGSPAEEGLVILHTNDTHSRLDPFPNDGRKWGGLGGAARRATLIEQLRAKHKNVLLFDCGDIFQGTPYFNYFNGEPEIKAMNLMKYDACTIGNHDFDGGIEGLTKAVNNSEFKWLCANYEFQQTSLRAKIKPYHIFQKGRLKVGVFGLGIDPKGLVPDKLCEGVTYKDPISVGREMLQQLKKENCDLIVCLSHLGYKYESAKVSDHVLAKALPEIDIILGGHTHTFLTNPDVFPSSSKLKSTIINQVGWAGVQLGKLEFQTQANKQITFVGAEEIFLT